MSTLKGLGLAIISAVLVILLIATPVLAVYIALPTSTPAINSKNIYRNVLETGDFLIILKENTPYASVPAIPYREAFVWRLIDTDNATELAQALGYSYNGDGYGYNVVSFYLSEAETTNLTIAWGDLLKLRLSGTPIAFASPPIYQYDITSGDYSSLTATADVKVAVAALIIELAHDLDVRWGLSALYSLLSDSETGTVLSLLGQAFFRGAIYGVQSMAPAAFPLTLSDVNVTDRTWDTEYSSNLSAQNTGNYIGTALNAGATFLDSNYNLFGLLLVVGIVFVLISGHWYLAGGNIMRGLVEASPALVIGSRIGIMGMGELGLIAAIAWLYSCAKLWRMI